MLDPAGQATLLRLMSWLSPAFPVGAFAYSHGLERAIHDGLVRDGDSLVDWLQVLIGRGSGWNDAVLLAGSWRADEDASGQVAELAEAMAGSRERHMEATLQGTAFMEAISVWDAAQSQTCDEPSLRHRIEPSGGGSYRIRIASSDMTEPPATYAVSVGRTVRANGIGLEPALIAYLHAFGSNLIQAAVRLVPLGQRDGVAAMAALEPTVLETARRASTATLDDLGSAAFLSEVMAMKHETQYSRVFRS